MKNYNHININIMPNYQKSKIYKLWSPSKNLVYYGSTVLSLANRLSHHKTDYKRGKINSSKLIIECEDYKMELIENYPCNNREQIMKREGEYIRNNDCVNKRIAGRNDKEYYDDNKEKIKEYYENNKEHIKEKKKEHYENNKEKYKEYYENNKTRKKK